MRRTRLLDVKKGRTILVLHSSGRTLEETRKNLYWQRGNLSYIFTNLFGSADVAVWVYCVYKSALPLDLLRDLGLEGNWSATTVLPEDNIDETAG